MQETLVILSFSMKTLQKIKQMNTKKVAYANEERLGERNRGQAETGGWQWRKKQRTAAGKAPDASSPHCGASSFEI